MTDNLVGETPSEPTPPVPRAPDLAATGAAVESVDQQEASADGGSVAPNPPQGPARW